MTEGRSVWLVLLEATGKQSFVFEANRLRQSLGASQMILESTTQQLVAALPPGTATWDPAAGRVIPSGVRIDEGNPVEVVIATSGKALVLLNSQSTAEDLVFAVTSSCLSALPGVRVVGVVERFLWGTGLNEASRRAHLRLDEVAGATARPRFLRLPIIEDCGPSGTTAACRVRRSGKSGGHEALSHAALAKEAARDRAIDRMAGLGESVARTAKEFDDREDSWVAVLHADGNGLGAVFSDFAKALELADLPSDDRTWIDQFRRLSLAVEDITIAAFVAATDADPVVPIVLGGDDLTALLPGPAGWGFARRYLHEFEELARASEPIAGLLPGGLTASAGLSFVKRHFPFSSAYRLAEELIASAKALKPDPAIDFHVLYDSSLRSLDDIRSPSAANDAWHSAGPYLSNSTAGALERLVDGLRKSDEQGRHLVSSSQIEQIRASCSRNPAVATAEWKRLLQRSDVLRASGPEDLLVDVANGLGRATMLFDAVSLGDVMSEPSR